MELQKVNERCWNGNAPGRSSLRWLNADLPFNLIHGAFNAELSCLPIEIRPSAREQFSPTRTDGGSKPDQKVEPSAGGRPLVRLELLGIQKAPMCLPAFSARASKCGVPRNESTASSFHPSAGIKRRNPKWGCGRIAQPIALTNRELSANFVPVALSRRE